MQPYYDRDGITLYCADNRAIMWPDADLVLTDPPYSVETHQGARTSADWEVSGGNEAPPLGIDFDALTSDDVDALFARLGAVARRWVVSFLDWRHTARLEAAPPATLRFVRFGVWVKPNGAPQFTGDRPAQGWESIAFLHRAGVRLRWNGGGRHAVYTHPIANQAHRISDHPNAKPIPLLAQLIRDFSDPGDLIFDPFAGSGAVLAAAHLTGRRAVGIELNERYCADLVHWLRAAGDPRRAAVTMQAGPGLFDEAA